jgi:transcriptional regulator with XRE-family HTH domain
MSTLYENIVALCETRGIKGGKLCTDIGISKGILTDLKMGRRTGLSAVTAQKIASYFDVSVGYLLGEEEQKNSPPSRIEPTEREARILDALRSKSPAEQKALLTLLGISED